MKHYHVLVGLRGCYMPDSNYAVTSLAKARACAVEEKRSWNEAEHQRDEEYRDLMHGDIRRDGCAVSKHNIIEITDCFMGDCFESED